MSLKLSETRQLYTIMYRDFHDVFLVHNVCMLASCLDPEGGGGGGGGSRGSGSTLENHTIIGPPG